MATITFNINDALVPRIAAAYGVSQGKLKATIIEQVKERVLAYEERVAFEANQAALDAAIATQLAEAEAAKATAATDIVIT